MATDAKLKSFVERYERLAEERKSISGDMGDVLSEAEGVGYDKAGIRRLVAWRAMDAADTQEREITDELYRAALTGEPKPNLEGVEPVDPLLQRAIAFYRTGATVREVQAALKAEGRKVALGTAHKLKRRAKPFLDAEKEAAASAFRPTATVHVHPKSVNVNKDTGEITDINPGAGAADAAKPDTDQAAAPTEEKPMTVPELAAATLALPPKQAAAVVAVLAGLQDEREHAADDPWADVEASKAKLDAMKRERGIAL